MASFDGIDPITVLHFLFRFVEERDLERILEVHAYLMIHIF